MSFELHECLNNRRYYSGAKKHKFQHAFDEQVYSDKHIMALMTLERELPGHTGCVNTLDWSQAGDKLLSGSDDTKLNIYQTFENYKLIHSISTGHRANIFCAKFMPHTSDSVVISGAGDSQIRIFDLQGPTSTLDSMYVCHSDQVKKICVYPDNPNEFLSCSQDGTVRRFDRRVPHLCSPHNVRSFITAQSKPARQYPVPDNPVHHECSPPVADYSKYNIEFNSMSINTLFPHYFAVAGMNDYIYLHDKRMMSSRASTSNTTESSTCVKRFSPTLDGINRPNRHITACKFSDSNSYELIGSWSSDCIYLFNINDSPNESTITTATTTPELRVPSNLNESYKNEESDQKKLLWTKIFDYLGLGDLDQAYNATSNLLHYITHHASPSFDSTLGKVCCYMMHATIYSYRQTERADWYDDSSVSTCWDSYFFESELDTIQQMLNDAKSTATSDSWQSYWALAIGYWILRGGYDSIADMDRKHILDVAYENIVDAIATQLLAHQTQSDKIYIDMVRLFSDALKSTLIREGYNSPSSMTPPPLNRYQWGKLMYITLFSPQEVSLYLDLDSLQQQQQQQQPDSNEFSIAGEDCEMTERPSDTSSSDSEHQREVTRRLVDADEEEDITVYTRIINRQIMDMYDSDSTTDMDLQEIAGFRDTSLRYFQSDIDVVGPRSKYEGHCNIETVKDVGFFGSNDEYIVSGSDGGYLFIWNKKTSKIVQILQADNEIVNVAKGHPTLPILAVSGIDSTPKIFAPISRPFTTSRKSEPNNPHSYSTSSRLYEQEAIVNTNRSSNQGLGADIYLTRSMIAALTRISRLNQVFAFNDMDEDDDETLEDEPTN